MIGILNSALESFIITDAIRKIYPSVNIYICDNKDIKKNIEKIRKKECKIIIFKQNYDISELKNKNKDLFLLTIPIINNKDYFLLDTKELVNAVINGNEKEVETILNNIEIPLNKTILINDTKLLLIKEQLSSKYPNKIVTSIDFLLSEINTIIRQKNIDCNNQKLTIIIN